MKYFIIIIITTVDSIDSIDAISIGLFHLVWLPLV